MSNDYRSRPGSQQSRPQQTQQRTQERPREQQGFTASQAGAGNQAPARILPKQKLFDKFSERFGIDQELLVETLKKTCFKQQRENAPPITNEQLVALLIVADQYGLNPFTKEIYAYPDKNGGIVPVVSVDGWIRIIQEHADYAGMELRMPDEFVEDKSSVADKFKHKKCWEWMEVTIFRKTIERPTPIVEFFDEVYRPPLWIKQGNDGYFVATPWQSHTKRMMRHKAIIQAGRVTFGFGGIYDQDEAERIIGDEINVTPTNAAPTTHTNAAKDALKARGTKAPIEGTATRVDPKAKAQPAASKPWEDDEFEIDKPTGPTPEQLEREKMAKDEYWVDRFNAVKDMDAFNTVLDACFAYHEEAGKEISVDLDANLQIKREELENG